MPLPAAWTQQPACSEPGGRLERRPLKSGLPWLFLLALFALLATAPARAQDAECCAGCKPPYTASYAVTVLPGYNYLVNHLCHGLDNRIDEVLPVVPDESQFYKWNKSLQSYGEVSTYYGGIGWVDPAGNPSGETLPPGEGFVLFNPGAPFTIKFTGGEPVCPLSCGPTNGCCLLGRFGAGLAYYTNLFNCPPVCGTRVSIWNPTNQSFRDYTFVNGAWTPQAPVLSVGIAAFVCVEPNTNCEPCDLPIITTQPADQTVAECSCVTFSVTATGGSPLNYQWFESGAAIVGANGISHTKCRVGLTDDGARYWVVVANSCGSVTSRVAILHVVPDTTPPALTSAAVDCASNKFTLVFSESLEPGTATDPANYSINGGLVNILSVALLADGRTVCLFTGPLGPRTDFIITANGITDLCGNTAFELTATVRCPCLVVTKEQLACSTDTVGAYDYTFDLLNNSGVPVKYLFLVPQDNCFSFQPDILTFRPPLPPGQVTNVSVRITRDATCSANFCFTLAAHDANFVQCCSITHCASVTAGPRLMSALPVCGSNKITVTFSAPLDPVTALNAPNFIVDDLTHLVSLALAGASFGGDYRTVCLYTAAPLSAGTSYRLTVNNVRDTCGNVIASDSQVMFSCPSCVAGTIRMSVQMSNEQLEITWTGGGHLQSASAVSGAWSDVPGATTPYSASTTGAARFYRVICP